jgi:hypothetical protein
MKKNDPVSALGKLQRVIELEAELRQIAQMVHQAHHQDKGGPWQACDRGVCQRVRVALGELFGAVPCQLDQPPFFQCCCKCIYRVEDFYYENLIHRGWICVQPGKPPHAISDWYEHSAGCEEYTTKEEAEREEKRGS